MLFLVQNQVLDPVLFALLAIQRKLFLDCGWIMCAYFILYKSNKKIDDSICSVYVDTNSFSCSNVRRLYD